MNGTALWLSSRRRLGGLIRLGGFIRPMGVFVQVNDDNRVRCLCHSCAFRIGPRGIRAAD